MAEVVVNCGRNNQRQHHRDQDPANDRDGKRLQHLRACAQGESQWQHARDSGQRCHHDGTQAAAAGLEHGIFGRETLRTKFLVGVEQENAIFRHDANNHNHAHERRNVESCARNQQGNENT